MEIKGVEWLEKIKDGSILSYLKEICEIERVEMPEISKKLLDEIVSSNKKGKFPKRKELIKKFNCSQSSFGKYINYLKNKKLVFDFSSIELLYVFKKSEKYKILPFELNVATGYEIMKLGRRCSSAKSWAKKFQNLRAPHYSRFYIALLSENGCPVFYSSFKFIPIYNSFVAPQTGQTHISLK